MMKFFKDSIEEYWIRIIPGLWDVLKPELTGNQWQVKSVPGIHSLGMHCHVHIYAGGLYHPNAEIQLQIVPEINYPKLKGWEIARKFFKIGSKSEKFLTEIGRVSLAVNEENSKYIGRVKDKSLIDFTPIVPMVVHHDDLDKGRYVNFEDAHDTWHFDSEFAGHNYQIMCEDRVALEMPDNWR